MYRFRHRRASDLYILLALALMMSALALHCWREIRLAYVPSNASTLPRPIRVFPYQRGHLDFNGVLFDRLVKSGRIIVAPRPPDPIETQRWIDSGLWTPPSSPRPGPPWARPPPGRGCSRSPRPNPGATEEAAHGLVGQDAPVARAVAAVSKSPRVAGPTAGVIPAGRAGRAEHAPDICSAAVQPA